MSAALATDTPGRGWPFPHPGRPADDDLPPPQRQPAARPTGTSRKTRDRVLARRRQYPSDAPEALA